MQIIDFSNIIYNKVLILHYTTMKKTLWILSLTVLLFSTLTPSFTFANNGDVEALAKEILTEELNETMTEFENNYSWEIQNNTFTEIEQNVNYTQVLNTTENQYIVHDKEKWLITIYSDDFLNWFTIKDKNEWAQVAWTWEDSYWYYYEWWEVDCWEWFHIPTEDDWRAFFNIYAPLMKWFTNLSNNLLFPYQWKQNDQTNNYIFFTFTENNSTWYIQINPTQNSFTSYNNLGAPVRCFKDEYVKKQELTITFDLWEWWYWITETWDKLREPTHNVTYTYDENLWKYKTQEKWRTPSRISNDLSQQSWWMFDWWYTNPNCSTNYEYCTNKWLWIEWPYLAEWVGKTTVYAKWLPFNDLEVEIGWEKIVIMDRNLWATTNDITKVWSYGNFYQRWNNYWFSRCSYNWCNIFNDWETKTNIKVSKSDWEWNVSTYYNSKWNTNNEWNEWATNEDNLWWWSKFNNFDTFRQWPCPDWYHVPIWWNYTESEWHRIYDKWDYEWNDSNDSLKFSNDLNLPFAGYRSNWWTMYNQNVNWYYLTSNPYDSSTTPFYNYMFRIDKNQVKIYPNAYSYAWTHWRSIRCFKDTSKIIHFETNSDNTLDDISSIRWWNFGSQWLPILNFDDIHMDFKGRFLTSNFLPKTKVEYIPETSEINEASLTLYAKIECERWFIRDWNKCIWPSTAILMTWIYLNVTLKWLVRWENLIPYYENFTSSDELIKWFVFSDNVPEDKIVISADYSDLPIYARYDSYTWIMYYYSEAEKIYLNPDSNFLFAGFDWLKELDLSRFNPHLTKKGMYWIILNTHNLEKLILDWWDVSNYPIINIWSMFSNAYWLKHLSLKNRIIPSYFESIIWARTTSLTSNLDSVDVSNRDLSSTYSLMWLFWNLKTKNIIWLDTWDTSNIVIMQNMFWFLSWVDTLDLSSWNTNNVREMNWMFYWSNVKELDLSSFNTENTSNMWGMFWGASSLKTIYVWKEFIVNSSINSWDMFLNATNIVWWNWTTYNSWYINWTYAVIDDKNNSWYFTDILDKQFSISYDLNWWVISWEIYKYTWRDSFSLIIPEKSWYTFKWWIWSNWENPQINVTINQWTKWDLSYEAQWKIIPEQDKQEGQKEQIPSAWGGKTLKQESKATEQEHNSADTKKTKVEEITTKTADTQLVKEQAIKHQQRSLTRWEVAVMTNILLDVFPQLVEWKQELDDVENACSNYADEQKFTKDEKKAITRLCKLSIMWIHADNNKPIDEFMVNERTKNNEFSKVINRSLSTYTEKDFSVVKEALKKLEDNEENVEFWTVYNVFMSIKELFN